MTTDFADNLRHILLFDLPMCLLYLPVWSAAAVCGYEAARFSCIVVNASRALTRAITALAGAIMALLMLTWLYCSESILLKAAVIVLADIYLIVMLHRKYFNTHGSSGKNVSGTIKYRFLLYMLFLLMVFGFAKALSWFNPGSIAALGMLVSVCFGFIAAVSLLFSRKIDSGILLCTNVCFVLSAIVLLVASNNREALFQ